ncbi:MAG: hypothetical protein IPN17_36215 [Deltaproteobacteria bacterium]|jgi:hypothetical protein|nr:hypothetical protein [Deltaproteobacteria bacterium]MBK8697552.1 hypothetical protein [Deltaproteobacteria bacterium]
MDPTTPTWRRGWTWTAIKCFTLTAALMGLGALALHLLLGTVVPPWYIPKPVFEWLMENVRPYALWLFSLPKSVGRWRFRRGELSFEDESSRLAGLA